MTRTDSPIETRPLAIACAAILAAGLTAGALLAEGKPKKGGGKLTVLTTQQHEILDAGAIAVRKKGAGKGKVLVEGIQGAATIPLTAPKKVKGGKRTLSLPLTDSGREAVGGCSIDGLRARFAKGKGKKTKKKGGAVAPLDRDLAVCSTGSENPAARPYYGPPIDTSNADRCDFLDPRVCMQPFPNDHFTTADPGTDTGRRLSLQAASMPHNQNGTPIDPTDFNRADGFSPGNEIIVKIPEVSTQAAFAQTGFAPVTDERRYADPGQPVVVINTDTGERHPVFAELDSLPGKFGGTAADVNLIVRPLRNFDEGGHYVVALRDVKDAQGATVPPPMPFRVYRDRLITGQGPIEGRRAHMEQIIGQLQGAGIPRANLYMAWDFTVASESSLAGRALTLRDAALAELGDTTPGDETVDGDAPGFEITNIVDNSGNPSNPVLRQIDGVLTDVPCYLTSANCAPGGRLTFPPGSDTPSTTPNGVARDGASNGVEFRCIVPRSVIEGGVLNEAQPGLFGHGLLGNHTQVGGQSRLANQHNSIWCGTSWAGFSDDDLGVVGGSLIDLSNFPKLTDRMLQGFVNFSYLGRALLHADGLNTDPAFEIDPDGGDPEPAGPVIDTSELYFEGISQGAIMGGALTALSTDFTRSVLNVTGMNYSTLLSRSTDSGAYLETPVVGLYANYPNQLERQLIFALMQLVWDRGEANGYAEHMTDDPLPDTPPHNVLLQVAPGDFQVANLTAEIEARTIGASVHAPALHPGRHWDLNPFLDLPPIGGYPFAGSAALVYYDGGPVTWFNAAPANTPAGMECNHGNPPADPCQGTAVAPTTNTPPVPGADGADSHSYPRRAADGLQHVVDWLQPGGFIDACGAPGPARPCHANGWTGP